MIFQFEQIKEFYVTAFDRCRDGSAWEFEKHYADVISEYVEDVLLSELRKELEEKTVQLEYLKRVSNVSVPDWCKTFRELQAYEDGFRHGSASK